MKTILFQRCNKIELAQAAEMIRDGKLVAFPTETVYGLGGNALMADAAMKIYSAKGRPSDNPLIIHLACPQDAENYCITSPMFWKLAQAFMPGPLTVILPKKACIPDTVTGGLSTVAVRVPSHPIARELIALAGVPIAAPSANLSGKPSTTCAEDVVEDLNGKIDAVLCAEPSEIGVESTIVKIDGDRLTLLRPGAITYEMLQAISESEVQIDRAILEKSDARPLAPGMKYRHYAPHMPVTVIDAEDQAFYDYVNARPDSGVLCFDEDLPYIKNKAVLSMGKVHSPSEQAHHLFHCLRTLDHRTDIPCVYARMPQKSQVGLAVWNRLVKAAGFDIMTLNENTEK
jgi:L-threonylcarbamoyladenylate synthase